MEKVLNLNSVRSHPRTSKHWTHHPLAMVSDGWSPDVDVLAMEQAEHDNRLPPTRAARTLRSRGVFLAIEKPARGARRRRLTDLAIAVLAVAVVTLSSALIMGAPATIMGAALNFNPGPGIVGSASVPPAFVEPSRGR